MTIFGMGVREFALIVIVAVLVLGIRILRIVSIMLRRKDRAESEGRDWHWWEEF